MLNIKFYQNPFIGSRVVPGGQTDMAKLIVAFRNFANAPKNGKTTQNKHLCNEVWLLKER